MKKLFMYILSVLIILICYINYRTTQIKAFVSLPEKKLTYWFLLDRLSETEFFYHGIPGVQNNSRLVATYKVKTGIPHKRPTPLPELMGRKYWKIINKKVTYENSETSPFFLTLDIPSPNYPPFGPEPYPECNGQCDWVRPGDFGLHGVGGDESKLAKENIGSSGCIRHKDSDITFLYNILDPEHEEIRYYVIN
jgi:hypothetical protein